MAAKARKIRGIWYVITHDKGRRLPKKSFGADGPAAKEAARQINLVIKLGELHITPKAEPITFKAFASAFLARPGEKPKKPVTIENYARQLRVHVYPVIGDTFVGDITRQQILDLITIKQGKLAHGSMKLVLAVLRAVLNEAVAKGLIATNPAVRLTRAIPKDVTDGDDDDVKVLTRDQIQVLLNATLEKKGFAKYVLFLCLARTGMRVGECLALAWRHIEFDRHRIAIRRNMSGGQFSDPKSHQRRFIDMTAQLESALRELRGQVPVDPAALVFPNHAGRPITYLNLNADMWKAVVDDLPFAGVTPHVLRHSFASQLLAEGRSIVLVSRLLGHKDVATTLKYYAHLMPSEDRAILNNLDNFDAPPAHPSSSEVFLKPVKLVVEKDFEEGVFASQRNPVYLSKEEIPE